MIVSLRTKILVLVAGATCALAVVVLVSLGLLAEDEIGKVLRRDVTATGALLSLLIRERTENMTDQCRLLASQPVLKAVIGTEDTATVTDSATDSLKQTYADAAMVTDENGKALGVTDSHASAGASEAGDSGVSAALRGVDWSGIITRRGRLVLAVCVPVFKDGMVFGTYSAYRRIDARTAHELRSDLGTDVAFVVDGKVRGASLDLPARLRIPMGSPQVVKLGGTPYLALYARLPNSPNGSRLGFITLRDYNDAVSPYSKLRAAFVLVFALTLIVAMAAGVGVARSLLRPLDGVVRAAQAIKDGGWPERFDVHRHDEIGLLQSVFNDMTAVVHNSQDRLLGLIDSVKSESLATIQALAAAVDAKDSYTRGHSQSVALYAGDLAEYIGLSPAEVELIHVTGTLHDVGKIGVPDAILQKPGRLTDEERATMETHPVLGELIILKVPSLAGILPGVKHHHERWDGRGYPDRLAAERIPLMARILALADSFDAMTSDRPYRKGMPVDVALAEIERAAGSQFDPDLAHEFVRMMRAGVDMSQHQLAA